MDDTVSLWRALDDGEKRLGQMSYEATLRFLGISRDQAAELQGYIKRLLDEMSPNARPSHAVPIADILTTKYKHEWQTLDVWEKAPAIWIQSALRTCVEAVNKGLSLPNLLLAETPTPSHASGNSSATRVNATIYSGSSTGEEPQTSPTSRLSRQRTCGRSPKHAIFPTVPFPPSTTHIPSPSSSTTATRTPERGEPTLPRTESWGHTPLTQPDTPSPLHKTTRHSATPPPPPPSSTTQIPEEPTTPSLSVTTAGLPSRGCADSIRRVTSRSRTQVRGGPKGGVRTQHQPVPTTSNKETTAGPPPPLSDKSKPRQETNSVSAGSTFSHPSAVPDPLVPTQRYRFIAEVRPGFPKPAGSGSLGLDSSVATNFQITLHEPVGGEIPASRQRMYRGTGAGEMGRRSGWSSGSSGSMNGSARARRESERTKEDRRREASSKMGDDIGGLNGVLKGLFCWDRE